MRETSTRAVDIAVVVVAADDGVMPQTVEAVDHARAARAQIVVAVTKVDAVGGDAARAEAVARVRGELRERCGVATEADGGDVPLSEVLDLRADADAPAEGVVVDTVVDARHGGTCCDVLVTWGRLDVGDFVVVGGHYGKVKRLVFADDGDGPAPKGKKKGKKHARAAGPADPCRVVASFAAQAPQRRRFGAFHSGRRAHGAEIRRLRAVARPRAGAPANRQRRCAARSFDRKRDGTFGSSVVDGDDEAAAAGPLAVPAVVKVESLGARFSPGPSASSAATSLASRRYGVGVRRHGVIYHLVDDVARHLASKLPPRVTTEAVARADVARLFALSSGDVVARLPSVTAAFPRAASACSATAPSPTSTPAASARSAGSRTTSPRCPGLRSHDLRVNDVVLGEDSQSVRGDGALSALEGDEGLDATSLRDRDAMAVMVVRERSDRLNGRGTARARVLDKQRDEIRLGKIRIFSAKLRARPFCGRSDADKESSGPVVPIFALPLVSLRAVGRLAPMEAVAEKLVPFTSALGSLIYVSHEWGGRDEPDPTGEQFEVLAASLEACDGGAPSRLRECASPLVSPEPSPFRGRFPEPGRGADGGDAELVAQILREYVDARCAALRAEGDLEGFRTLAARRWALFDGYDGHVRAGSALSRRRSSRRPSASATPGTHPCTTQPSATTRGSSTRSSTRARPSTRGTRAVAARWTRRSGPAPGAGALLARGAPPARPKPPAASHGPRSVALATLLLDRGADPTPALKIAAAEGNAELCALLERRGGVVVWYAHLS
ncbi:hypothetical protein JL721_12170 [Aureococcus anophagefferens]|nr:hypothetical protein JL721_12170 [Aureococcus anophagefferens]